MANRISIRTHANALRSQVARPNASSMARTTSEAFNAIQDHLDQLDTQVTSASTAAAAATSTSKSSSSAAPAQYSTVDSTLSGAVNGVNVTFPLPAAGSGYAVYRNGLLMTQGANGDYTIAGASVVFASSQTPQTGDIVTILIWP